uniref:Tc1-like transposase DDE domain-containing protein n=1 Tax=Sinocyclocheilus anshuiensis TaxID=1608454 RepID=A0A671RQX7_9TELE
MQKKMHLPWPNKSPDLNIIKPLWTTLERRLYESILQRVEAALTSWENKQGVLLAVTFSAHICLKRVTKMN